MMSDKNVNKKNKQVFTVKVDDKDVEFAVIRPTADMQQKAQIYYNKMFGEALRSGAILKESLLSFMKKQDLWDGAKQTEQDELLKILEDGTKKLSRGNIKLSEAKRIALDMRVARVKIQELLSDVTELYPNTVEGQADTARFNYLTAMCLVYNNSGERVYSTVEEYLKNTDSEIAINGSVHFSQLYYGVDNEQRALLPENKFLIKYEFVNKDLQLVNKEGQLVDSDGKRIDEFGYYLDDDGNRIDRDGNPLDENGCYKFETQPFLDENNQPIQTKTVAEKPLETVLETVLETPSDEISAAENVADEIVTDKVAVDNVLSEDKK
jgi:hypothetical protein